MRFEPIDFHPDIRCPHCYKGFDVETTHEESREECYGIKACPSCGMKMEIEPVITFIAHKVE